MKSFYKVFVVTVLTLFVFILAFRSYSETHYLTNLWQYNYMQEGGYIPLLLIWLLPVAMTLTGCLVGRICRPRVRLITWTRKALATDFFIFIGSVLISGIWLFLWESRELWEYPEHIILVFSAAVLLALLIILIKDAFPLSFGFLANLYISALLLSAVFTFCGIFVHFAAIKAHYLEGLTFNYVAYFLGMILLLSVAGVIYKWLSGRWKIVSYIMGGIVALLFISIEYIALRYPFGVVYHKYFSISDFRIPRQPEPEIQMTDYYEEEEEEDISVYYDEIERDDYWNNEGEGWDYQPEIHFFTFEFLWDNPGDDSDSIRATMHYVNKHVDFDGVWTNLFFIYRAREYGWNAGKAGRDAYLKIMEFLCDYRQQIDLPSIFEAYARYLPAFIPYSVYKENGIEKIVKQLLLTYDDLVEESTEFERLDVMHQLMNGTSQRHGTLETYEEESVAIYYQVIADHTRAADYTESFVDRKEVDYARIIWAYSFWGRRYHEGIHQDVHYILKRLEQIYNPRK